MAILAKVKNTITENKLIAPGDSILIGLSGGPDSVALAHLLSRLSEGMKLRLFAVYVNHGIRRRAAAEEERHCQHLCRQLDIELTIVRKNVPAIAADVRTGIEETARNVRYHVFETLASENGHKSVAVGHHANDRAETILFRILRGTGCTGLQGIPVRRGRIIRPLHNCTRDEISAYLREHKLGFCIDKSNRGSNSKRNYIRNRLLVDIRKNLNPAVDLALLNLSETAAGEELFLEGIVSKALKRVVRTTVGRKIELDLAVFNNYDIWLRRRVLRHCVSKFSEANTAPDKKVVDRLVQLGMVGGKALSLPGHVQVVLAGERLVFYKARSHRHLEKLLPGKLCRLENPGLTFRCRQSGYSPSELTKERRAKRVVLDRQKLVLPLVVREIRPGDRFSPLGMKGTKKVGDYLTDKKVHRIYRDEIPVVCDSEGIVWLVGFEIADRVKVDHSTREVLAIEVSRQRKNGNAAV